MKRQRKIVSAKSSRTIGTPMIYPTAILKPTLPTLFSGSKKYSKSPRKTGYKKPKSGNHTSNSQYLYILWNLPFFWTVKVGITGDLNRRLVEIDKTNKGVDLRIFSAKILFAYQVEQWVHEKCRGIQVHSFKGSGRTERFLFPAIFPALFGVLVIRLIEWVIIFLVFALFAWAIINAK